MKRILANTLLIFATLPAHAEAQPQPDVYVAIIEIWPIDGEYDGYYCPPLLEDEICLGDSILIQKGALSRPLSINFTRADPRLRAATRRDSDGQYLRFRMIGGHAQRRVAEGRYIAVLEPTNEGYVFVQWRNEYAGGRACLPADLIAHYGERLQLPDIRINEVGASCLVPR